MGLLECSRRLGWALNTVKRYARAATASGCTDPPYGPASSTPTASTCANDSPPNPACRSPAYRRDPRLGYTGSANLLVRYLNQGRADADAHHRRRGASSAGS